ncbi:MAG TPA: Maf family protein, partial [Bacillota bacterium]|nr:Maf family protein [Bacillota bacterium]
MARLILASASPRRIELLGSLGLIFDIVPSSADEYVDGRPDPGLLVETLAKRKAQAVSAGRPFDVVLGADTV